MKYSLYVFVVLLCISCKTDRVMVKPIVGAFEISGQVFTAKDHAPLPGITVQLGTLNGRTYGDQLIDQIVTTDENGFYQFIHDGPTDVEYFIYYNSQPYYDSLFYNDAFYFKPMEENTHDVILHPYTQLRIKAENTTPNDPFKMVYISCAWEFCWCDDLTTTKAVGNGETIITWFLNGDDDVNHDTVFTKAGELNEYTLFY